ncbi:DUF1084 domain-containing protein [Cephalotus follicularis]|uniref:DUF1084 domain-containing protein n=1 Tax=Cephalotus follicularis TaxID=3775 RepID=A0A1Q3BC69_CEPFO|nr:DUF1084 domain-containing protein [Cephalotus follicularis]
MVLILGQVSCYCFQREVVGVNVGLACVDAILAFLSFTQLIRIHSRNSQLGWTRQKVFHILIGSSNIGVLVHTHPRKHVYWILLRNMGYFIYLVLTLVATCQEWLCWSYCCGFIFMACPRILLFSAFLLLLSFWVDLCHPADDEDEEDEEHGFLEALLERSLNITSSSNVDGHRLCFPFRLVSVGSRQKIVILVTILIFVLMMTFAVLIWIEVGNNSVDSSKIAKVYVDLFAIAILLLGGALAYYGLLLCLKMRKGRSERVSSEMCKVAGLAVVSVICFTSSALVALFTKIPVLYQWLQPTTDGVSTSLLLILYYFIGSSVPSAFVLWVMRELPSAEVVGNTREESSTVTFISDCSASVHHLQSWTASTSSLSQVQEQDT